MDVPTSNVQINLIHRSPQLPFRADAACTGLKTTPGGRFRKVNHCSLLG